MVPKVEANARTRISGLVSELVDKDFVPRAILMGEHLSLGNLGTKTPPVEIKHMKPDGSIHSTFLSGTLDYICCSSHSENSAGIDTWDEVMMKWKTKSTSLDIPQHSTHHLFRCRSQGSRQGSI